MSKKIELLEELVKEQKRIIEISKSIIEMNDKIIEKDSHMLELYAEVEAMLLAENADLKRRLADIVGQTAV
jgi:hypothetical protein